VDGGLGQTPLEERAPGTAAGAAVASVTNRAQTADRRRQTPSADGSPALGRPPAGRMLESFSRVGGSRPPDGDHDWPLSSRPVRP